MAKVIKPRKVKSPSDAGLGSSMKRAGVGEGQLYGVRDDPEVKALIKKKQNELLTKNHISPKNERSSKLDDKNYKTFRAGQKASLDRKAFKKKVEKKLEKKTKAFKSASGLYK